MFRITAVPDLNNKRPVPQYTKVEIFKISPGAFVMCVTTPDSELSLDSKSDGLVLYSPWGQHSKIDFTVNTSDEILKNEFLHCRVFDLLDVHTPNQESKYFLSKVLLPEDNWSQTEEDRLINMCHEWIFKEEWRNSSPIGVHTYSQTKGN